MSVKIGIDVGGTFTDFFYVRDGREPSIFKTLSTPHDPSIAVVNGLTDIAAATGQSLQELAAGIDTIVHGTTVTTNATLTRTGAKMGLITTKGVRDAVEMRRGIREEQYNNRYTNVPPLVRRYLRQGVTGRLDRMGREVEKLSQDEVRAAVELFRQEKVEAVAICFMNAFANPAHEQEAAKLVRRELPGAYLSVSTDMLPSIRFYERVSTTCLNSYVGPKLTHYLNQLLGRLKEAGFKGLLLIMQSNGGVITPEIARDNAALTLLSGPAAGPGAGLVYARAHGIDKAITTDMGGTSFEASLAMGDPVVITEGEIDRHRIALPMLGIHTIGAGGGSIGWIDEGGLLRMGPASAGADPGPASYGKGGEKPCSTDANLVLGYLDPSYFAGGKMSLDLKAARKAIETHIAKPMRLSVEEAAAGMYRIICTNMAQGVREVSIKRGHDPREFPLIAAGGAGPIHSCLICDELEMPLQIVPRSSSILCAFGMLMSDLKHDFVRTFVARLADLDWKKLNDLVGEMAREGDRLLACERIAEKSRATIVKFDCRYLKQYHEVSFEVPASLVKKGDAKAIAKLFHAEHNRLYGYSLDEQGAPVEIINLRVQAVGKVAKPSLKPWPWAGADARKAQKGKRSVYVPEARKFQTVPVYDGHAMKHGNRVAGPAMIEQVTTAIFLSAGWDCVVDKLGSFALYRKGREDLVAEALKGPGKSAKPSRKKGASL
ncbi:MAG: hydantoinase/oxoprolinase family protein [Rhodospirillales bacterium]|nr:hydantoinase/oxoprolinase family protein [Rhodospirillales bacterium]